MGFDEGVEGVDFGGEWGDGVVLGEVVRGRCGAGGDSFLFAIRCGGFSEGAVRGKRE